MNNAAKVIQKNVRMFLQRKSFLAHKSTKYSGLDDKMKLNLLLADMEHAIAVKKNTITLGVEEAAERIQNMARKFFARKAFKNELYKLLLLKNIVENKMHKEKMAMLYGFEQLIVNVEEQQSLQDESQIDFIDDEGKQSSNLVQEEIMKLTNVSSATSAFILKALIAAQEKGETDYDLDPADVIKEEEYEESSVGDLTNRKSRLEAIPSQRDLPRIQSELSQVDRSAKFES